MVEKYEVRTVCPAQYKSSNDYFEAAKKSLDGLPKATVGQENFLGTFWVVRESDIAQIGRILEIRMPDGKVISESAELSEFIPKVNQSYWTVKPVSVDAEKRCVVFELDHEIDDKTIIDKRTGTELSKDLQALLEEKISLGIVSAEEAEERITYMRDNGAKEMLILAVVKEWEKHEKMPVKPDPLYVDKTWNPKSKRDSVVVRCLKHLTLGYSLIVKSPRGLGKLVLSLTLAWLRGQGTYTEIFSADTTIEVKDGLLTTDNTDSEWLSSDEAYQAELMSLKGDVCARARLNLAKAKAMSVHLLRSKSNLLQCMLDNGMFIVDEINLGDPNIVEAIFNPLLDGHKALNFPGIGEVKAKRPFAVIASMNEGYEGTNVQNRAMESRFKHIVLEYPKTLRDIIEKAAKAELRANGFGEVEVRRDLLDQAEQYYNKLFAASTNAPAGTSAMISDTALNIRGFASAIVICMAYNDSSLAQYLEDDVVNCCDIEERPVLKNMMADTVTC